VHGNALYFLIYRHSFFVGVISARKVRNSFGIYSNEKNHQRFTFI
jgi:hypothetical protein